MALTTTYSVPLAATVRLDALVARITANPGNMLQPAEIARYSEGLSVRPAFDHLPEGMADGDFIGVLKLALLTECATDTYAEAIDTRARSYDAPWLGNFIKDVWVPDEMSHHTPYRTMLLSAGFTEAELDTEIRQTIDRVLDYNSGDTPIHLTTYGMIQEYLTDNWHGLIARLLKQSVPNAARLANRVKQRETLHTLWYRDMTILQLEANPRLLTHVAEAVGNFEMPGKSLVPELEPDVPRWLPLLGNDFDRWARDLVRMLYQIAGDTSRAGQLLIEVAAERGTRIGPLSPTVVRSVMDRLGGPGYGLLGEAMLERVGLGYLYRDKPSYGWRPPLASRLRGMLREWVAGQIELKVAPDEMPGAHGLSASMPVARQRVAIVGAGISGLTAAYLLRETHDVTVFEAEARPGGHANTVTLGNGPGAVHVDTGFIVYNETTYPGFSALLKELDVPTQPGDMSFGSTCERCGISFSSHGLGGLFAQRRNLLRSSQWRLLPDLNRFYRHARAAMARHPMPSLTLGDYATRFGADRPLVGHYVLPMAAAIWSTSPAEVRGMPFAHLARFLDNHGLIGWGQRLQWRTVTGGSRAYVQRLVDALPVGAVRTSASVQAVTRPASGGACVQAGGIDEAFDAVALACHADVALALLVDASAEEREALGGFTYTANEVVLHTDDRALPRNAAARASWNVTVADCRDPSPRLAMTYDMNRLQSLDGPVSYCVSVNPGDSLDPGLVISRHAYTHPRYDRAAVEAQAATARIQGQRATYFAGAHLGYGFHEDGYQSGVRVAATLQAAL